MKRNLLIKNGTIVDGTGGSPFQGDLRVFQGKIAEIGKTLEPVEEEEVLDAQDMIVCPGFIDAHCHTDMYAADCPDACGKIMQGVTTDVCGLCGDCPAPVGTGNLEEFRRRKEYQLPGGRPVEAIDFKTYRDFMNRQGNTTNMALFVGNCNLRVHAVGYENRPASAAELDEMKGLLRESMEEGAYGLSTGLTYVPSMFASKEELIELSRVIAPFGGIYNSHMRNEGDYVLEAIQEVIDIAEKSGCIGHVSHLKTSGLKNHGRSGECLELIHRAADRGVPITFDVYPYTAGSCGLRTLMPPDVLELGIEDDYQAMKRPEVLAQIRRRLQETDWDNLLLNCGTDGILVAAAGDSQYVGKTLGQIQEELQVDSAEALIRILAVGKGQGSIIYQAVCEEDLIRFMQDPLCTIGTDAFARNYTGPTAVGRPHPRNYGAFPRWIQYYLLEKQIMPLEKGIEKITSLPARHFGLEGRGALLPGWEADLTIFDPRTIRETGDFMNPAVPPVGIEYVMVAGELAVKKETFQPVRAGRVLRRHQ